MGKSPKGKKSKKSTNKAKEGKIIKDKSVKDAPEEEAVVEDEHIDDEPAEDKPADDKPAKGTPTKDKSAKDKPAKDKTAKDKTAKDKPAKGSPVKDKPAKDKSAKGSPAKDKPAKGSPAKDKPAKGSPAKDKPAKGSPVKDKPAKNKPVEDKPVEDKPVEDKPVEDKPVEDKPVEDKPVEDKSVEDKPVDDKPVDDKPVEDVPCDDKSADDTTTESTDVAKSTTTEEAVEETSDKVTESEPMETDADDEKTSSKDEKTSSVDEVDLEEELSKDSEKDCVIEEGTEGSDLNDSIIICESEKDNSSPNKSLEEGEVMSSNEIEDAVIATQIDANDERTVEDGEWTEESRLASFMKWVTTKGISMSPKVTVSSEGTCHRFGMVATADIKKGETLFTVPRSLTLHPDNSRIVAEIVDYEDWLDSIGQSLDDSSGWATLLIALMLEFNDKDSFWAPYLRLVPKPEEFGHPLFWTAEEHKTELKGMTLLYDIQRDVYNIESEYKQYILPFIYRYKDICGRTDKYNLSLYKRLVAFVMAYSFTEDFDSQPSMIPMADMLNHSTNNNAHLVFGEDDLKMVALRKIDKGEEVLNTFGKLGNAELLQMYGYADKEPNIFDTLPILVNTFLDVMEKQEKVSDSFFQAKVSLLNKTEIAPADDFFLFDKNGMRKGPDLIQMLKILFMPEPEFEELLKSRAGNRPDSFYQKLLRKLKLARKTDTSSGVAIIDITDEEPEIEPPAKRKVVDLQEIDDNEPPCKQSRSSEMQMMYLQLSHNHPEQSFPLNLLQQSQYGNIENPYSNGGNTMSNAIVIDDSDEEDEAAETDATKSKTADENKNKSSDESLKKDSKTDDESSGKDAEDAKVESPSDDANKKDNSKTDTSDSKQLETDESSTIKKVDVVDDSKKTSDSEEGKEKEECPKEKDDKEDSTKEDTGKAETEKEKKETSEKSDKSDESKVDKEGKENESSKESTEEVAKDAQSTKEGNVKEAGAKEDKNKDKKVNGDISDVVSIGDDIEDDLEDVSNDSDVDDIEIVSEDIRCKVTYVNLVKDLKPEWKEFIKSLLEIQVEGLKEDAEMTADEARKKMSDREFFSYQVRQGQRSIVKTFLESLAT